VTFSNNFLLLLSLIWRGNKLCWRATCQQ